MMSRVPFQLLELNIISAQDLSPVTKKLQTYAIIWINPERKFRTRIDQKGKNNPTWNDKFIFRVDDEFLNSTESTVMIELHAPGWLKDIPVGLVQVSITNLIPHSVRTSGASSSRIVALQIRRPSGRPQGILNMGVTLLDNTMRSMPMYRELYEQQIDIACKEKEARKKRLKRSRSDVSDLATKEKPGTLNNASSLCNGQCTLQNNVPYGSSMIGSVMNGYETGGQGGNGSICYSDIGPSPSVVALAVARGLILTPIGVPRNAGSSILADWKTEQSNVEGLKSKIARWRTEYSQLNGPQNNNYQKIENTSRTSNKVRKLRRSKTDGGGLFRCFGNAYGFQISITCGGGHNNGRKCRGPSCDNKSSMVTTSW